MDKLLDLFSFEGRANRAWYFWHIVLDDLAIFTAIVLIVGVAAVTGSPLFLLPAVGVVLAGTWMGIAITVKRLHDLDRPGWHWWLLFIPLYNVYLGLVLLLKQGTPGPNRYGTDPLAGAYPSGYLTD